MNNKNYPLWLKIAKKLPLKWKQFIRQQALMIECWSTKLVIDDDELIQLIENCETPNYQEFDKRLKNAQTKWKIHDNELAGLGVTRRFNEFKRTHENKFKSIGLTHAQENELKSITNIQQ